MRNDGADDGQLQMIVVELNELIPYNHLLKKIDACVSFTFIYDLLAHYFPATGRPSVDPVSMFKMLLIGYLYGIKSERRLVEEIQLNIAYRWFCGFDFGKKIPDHSTFSKTRIRKWNESNLFEQAFTEIVHQCITAGLVDGKEMVDDGSYIPAQVSKSSWIEVEEVVEVSMQSYLNALDQELAEQPGFKKPSVHTEKK
ncbi:transposase [Oscillibacter sp.]|uniref:transposase n=1 Tax=Oscillibacter sp. TaxID=1945593 RepID=UPI0033980CF7